MNIYLIALGRNQVKNSYAKIQLVGRHGKASQLYLHVLYLCAAGEGVQGKPDCLEEEEEFPGLSFWFEAVTLRHDEILETRCVWAENWLLWYGRKAGEGLYL